MENIHQNYIEVDLFQTIRANPFDCICISNHHSPLVAIYIIIKKDFFKIFYKQIFEKHPPFNKF